MRIVRFTDDKDQVRYGCNYDNQAADLLEGDFATGFKKTGQST
jgi:hypothetical protein